MIRGKVSKDWEVQKLVRTPLPIPPMPGIQLYHIFVPHLCYIRAHVEMFVGWHEK